MNYEPLGQLLGEQRLTALLSSVNRCGEAALVSSAGLTIATYADLNRWSQSLAARLSPRAPGAVLSCVLSNSIAFVVTLLAAWKLDAVLSPISPRATQRERSAILDALQPQMLVTETSVGVPPCVRTCILWSRPDRPEPDTVDSVLAPWKRPDLTGPLPGPGDALVLFTSGSTGKPKGVILTRDNVDAGISAVLDSYRLTAEDRTVAALPWTHGHGLIGALLSTLAASASIVVGSSAERVDALTALRTSLGVTWISVVPPQLRALCESCANLPSTWRFVRTASAPLGRTLAMRAESMFQCPVAEAYGMTETAHQAAANGPLLKDRTLGSVGRPSGTSFRLCGPAFDSGRQLEVAGHSVFRGYLRDPQATRVAMNRGWYRTGDIGTIDGQGRIWLTGRLSEQINRSGNKISPVEVEEVLAEHPDVLACLVVGIPDQDVGEEIAALIQPRPDRSLSVSELFRHCAERLSPHKSPRLVRFVAEIPSLANGKPSRARARKLLVGTNGETPLPASGQDASPSA